MSMPKRPKQHELESASERAFESALPSEWVFRKLGSDYGIDAEVEIFEGGRATGRTFKVQLKGRTTERLEIRLKRETDAYYAALRLPVLLALFHEPTRQLLVRWYHSLDPFLEPQSITSSSVLYRFSEEHRWGDETPDRLNREVEMFYRIRTPSGVLPLGIGIVAEAPSVRGISASTIEARLRSMLSPFADVIAVSSAGQMGEHGSVFLAADALRVDLHGAKSYTMHFRDEDQDHDAVGLAHDAVLVLALLLDHVGQTLSAARIIEEFAGESHAMLTPEIAQHAGSILVRAGRSNSALELSQLLQGQDDGLAAAVMLEVPLLLAGSSVPKSDRSQIATRLGQVASDLVEDSPLAAAAASRNAAMWWMGLGRHKEALAALDLAAELDPGYLERAYFHRERGGAQFLTGDFKRAAEAYAKALELGSDFHLLSLYGDALMYTGRFADARAALADYNRQTQENKPEWRLKQWLLDTIIEFVGETRDINMDEGCRIALGAEEKRSRKARERELRRALEADALCGQAWERLGALRAERDSFDEALPCFLVAAMVTKEIRHWMLSVAMAVHLIEDSMFRDIVWCGYFFNRDDFADAIGQLSSQLDEPVAGRLVALLDEVMRDVHEQSNTLEFRFLADSGYESLSLRVE